MLLRVTKLMSNSTNNSSSNNVLRVSGERPAVQKSDTCHVRRVATSCSVDAHVGHTQYSCYTQLLLTHSPSCVYVSHLCSLPLFACHHRFLYSFYCRVIVSLKLIKHITVVVHRSSHAVVGSYKYHYCVRNLREEFEFVS
jgi:hypothetical protein